MHYQVVASKFLEDDVQVLEHHVGHHGYFIDDYQGASSKKLSRCSLLSYRAINVVLDDPSDVSWHVEWQPKERVKCSASEQ